ncbi:MAG: hypothetical protein M3Z28_10460 [Candidatus Dormibacteraeota bacterium]|nr:hypothetical protein [Candidatus Dormibacteraeota bacterium]
MTTALLIAAVASFCAVLPAAAAVKAQRSSAVPSINRTARAGVAASPTTLFRSRVAPPSSGRPTFRAQPRAQAASD